MLFKIESWNFQKLFEMEFRETSINFNSIRQSIEKNKNNNCLNELNELKFCEVSRNSFSKRFWKFQLSILKNKKVLFLKKKFFKPLSISKQKKLCLLTQFSRGFWLLPYCIDTQLPILSTLHCTGQIQSLWCFWISGCAKASKDSF